MKCQGEHCPGGRMTTTPSGEKLWEKCSCVCRSCDNTGYVMLSQTRNGKEIMVARSCECREKTSMYTRMRQIDLPPEYEHCDFKNYQPQASSQKAAHLAARNFVLNYQKDGTGILFYGPTKGRGKTHLAVACLKELVQRNHMTGVFIDFLRRRIVPQHMSKTGSFEEKALWTKN